ncbi:MAG: twin-arginine translocation signal domain-containing protein, partial [Bacteroidales bacterium]|nr:twin-arginine translocation signal domain-containing protein [Bacteroidales bacterium]
MKKESSIERRQFLKLSSTAVLAGFAGKISGHPLQEEKSIIEQAAQKVGRFSRRKLGYSQREVSVLLGAGDMAPMLMEAGVLCGMNYWHKANRWMTNGAPET